VSARLLGFRDRADAGRALAREVARRHGARPDAIVLALPRGGVPVAAEVARALGAPLDVFVVRKLGLPGHPELAMGAVATGGVRVLHPIAGRVPPEALEAVTTAERREVLRRDRLFRGGRPPPDVVRRTVFLVDDGLATGSTMEAAVEALRRAGCGPIVVAVPVGSREACERIGRVVEDLVCVVQPEPFWAVGQAYDEFRQVEDDEVRRALEAFHAPAGDRT
jgi:predicted phosphoribosyltransferase